jgi:adenosylcobinamide kinase/adenosylcobinamide-phosphate guanylyltransferase
MVTGVSGSGKSEYAEQISCQLAKDNKKYYVATMYPYGEDGRSRVKKHKLQRDGKGFETIEQYQNIGGALKGCKRDTKPVVLVECMSNLLANECFEENGHPDNIFAECMQLYSECSHLVIVTNEVFSDGCEYDDSGESFERQYQILKRAELNSGKHQCRSCSYDSRTLVIDYSKVSESNRKRIGDIHPRWNSHFKSNLLRYYMI